MKCPKCQSENIDTRKFCRECGEKLILLCLQCNSENLPGDKFCGECGESLLLTSKPAPRELSFDEKIDKIQRYLPKGLTEKILSQRDRIEGERKQVTVMFCDMEGFTPLVERVGPENAYDIMNQVYEILIHKVHDLEGTVNEMTGDGIMALFGAPIALEDAPQRAIRAAFAIHREMAKFSDRARQEKKAVPDLKMRIGMHTGPVVVGSLGNDLRVEFKAVGDTVNLASRMEGLALPGTTYITEETFKLTEGLFRFEALGEKKVKGKEEAVNVYRVIAPSSRRTRFDVSAEGGLTPLMGRNRELELLLDGFDRVKSGRGQAFSIVAEAGVGKSRLLYEFRKAVSNEDINFLEGKCLSYSRGVAYHPVIDILKSTYDIQDNDGESDIKAKIRGGLKTIGLDEASTLPYLLELLSVKDTGIDKISMTPEVRKNRTIEALNRIVLKASEIRPLIIAVEDLHWIDESSEDRFKSLLENISGARVFLIFTYRPEFLHTWGAKSYHSQINLNRLSNRESLSMVYHLLGSKNVNADLEDLILEKTEGVPFFIEEFVKSLKDLRMVERENNIYHLAKTVKDMTIPATVQDIIMAKVDSLPLGSKELLQTGAVIEREFTYELITRVMGISQEELLSNLAVLKDSELIYERGIYPQSSYIFKHALTREVVYDSILAKRKKKLHEEIGQAMEDIYTHRLEEFYEMLAHHYSEGANSKKSYEYLKLSGIKAAGNYSNWEAYRFYREAIDALKMLHQSEEIKVEQIKVCLLMAAPMFIVGFPENSLEILQEGERLSRELGDKRSLAHLLSQIGQYHSFKGEILFSVQYSEAAFEEAKRIGDIELTAPIGVDLCLQHWRRLDYFKLIDIAPKIIALLEKTGRRNDSFGKPYNLYSVLHSWYAASKSLLGNFNEGRALFKEGIDYALEIREVIALAWLFGQYGGILSWMGDPKKAIEELKKAIRYIEEGDIVFISGIQRIHLGIAYCYLGELERARDFTVKGVKMQLDGGARFHMDIWYAYSSMVHLEYGDLKTAQHHAEKALEFSKKDSTRWGAGYAWIQLGRIFEKTAVSKVNKAEKSILKGIKILEDSKIKPLYAQGYHYLGKLYTDRGQKEKAIGTLKKAEEMFKEMAMDYWATRSREILEKM